MTQQNNPLNSNIMQNIDKKVRLILRLNQQLKRHELFLISNSNAPAFMQDNIEKSKAKNIILKNVLSNLNYLNY